MSTVVRGAPVPEAGQACRRCDRRTIPRLTWCAATREQRRAWITARCAQRGSRGLCHGCYRWASKHDHLIDYERRYRVTDEVLEEWNYLADPSAPVLPEVRRLAPRMGMTVKALEQALIRGGVRSRFEGGKGERLKAS